MSHSSPILLLFSIPLLESSDNFCKILFRDMWSARISEQISRDLLWQIAALDAKPTHSCRDGESKLRIEYLVLILCLMGSYIVFQLHCHIIELRKVCTAPIESVCL